MSKLVATLSRLPLLVAILATVLALGLVAPVKAHAATLVSVEAVELTATLADDENDGPAFAETEAEPDADPHSLPDAVLVGTPSLPHASAARLTPVRADREFASCLASLDRPPSSGRLALRGGRPG